MRDLCNRFHDHAQSGSAIISKHWLLVSVPPLSSAEGQRCSWDGKNPLSNVSAGTGINQTGLYLL